MRRREFIASVAALPRGGGPAFALALAISGAAGGGRALKHGDQTGCLSKMSIRARERPRRRLRKKEGSVTVPVRAYRQIGQMPTSGLFSR